MTNQAAVIFLSISSQQSTATHTRAHTYTDDYRQASLALLVIPRCCRQLMPQSIYDADVRARLPVTATAGAAVAVECVHGRSTVADIHSNRSPVNARTT